MPRTTYGDENVQGLTLDEYQEEIRLWLQVHIGEDQIKDKLRHVRHLLEEACEVAQSVGMPMELQHAIVHWVSTRPAGHPEKEIGDVAWTAAAVAASLQAPLSQLVKRPPHHTNTSVQEVRRRYSLKPTDSQLLKLYREYKDL